MTNACGRLTWEFEGPAFALPFDERVGFFLAGAERGDAVGTAVTADEALGASGVPIVRVYGQEAATTRHGTDCTSHPLAVFKEG